MRHRLDKHGKRYGKVIDFAVSELRAIELLDDLCDEMKKYQLGSDPDSEDAQIWVLSADVAPYQEGDKEPPSKDLLKEQRRVLSNACADIVGRWEEDLTVAIREGKAGDPSVREVLCVKLGGYCESDGFYGFEGSDEL